MSRHHHAIRNDPRWKAARLECLERDAYACRDCGVTEEELEEAGAPLEDRIQADHVVELSVAPELALEVDNLEARCGPCNRRRHTEGAATAPRRLHWINPTYAHTLETAGVTP